MLASVLITGASSGFGAAIAKKFAALGHPLILLARRYERLDALAATLQVPTHLIKLDLRDRRAVAAAIEQIPNTFQPIGILVNNAGLALGLEPAPRADLDDWEAMIDTNIKGLLYITRAIMPQMVAAGSGHVVNIGSIAGNWPYPGSNTYGASKAFVKQFSFNLRADLQGSGVRVTNIEPGLAETEFSLVRFKGDREAASKVYQGTQPLLAADIAAAVIWATRQPPHVNINRIEIMPTCQAFGALSIHRKK